MRYIELVKRGFVVVGDLSEEIRDYLSDGYHIKWQQTLSYKKNYKAKKVS